MVRPCTKAHSAGEVGVVADGAKRRPAGAVLRAGRKPLALKGVLGHQAVEVGVLPGVATIRERERTQRIGVVERRLQDDGQLLEAGRDDRVLHRLPWDRVQDLASARALRALGPSVLVVGHGPAVRDPGAAMEAAIARAERPAAPAAARAHG
jgi:hypothetical protein